MPAKLLVVHSLFDLVIGSLPSSDQPGEEFRKHFFLICAVGLIARNPTAKFRRRESAGQVHEALGQEFHTMILAELSDPI